MIGLEPLETLYDAVEGDALPLPSELAALYGALRLPRHQSRAHVIANFVSSLDGVVSLNEPGETGGGEISGFNTQDQAVMGLLRAAADAVVVGAGTLRSVPEHLWTPECIYPPLDASYRRLREAMGKCGPPLNVVVTGRGMVEPSSRVFRTGEVPALVVTTKIGARRLRELGVRTPVDVDPDGTSVSAKRILAAVRQVRPGNLILVEGGPRLIADFFGDQALDELFLTVAPQIAGSEESAPRPGLVAGRRFAPEHPIWGTLAGVKRAGSHLFLRYSFLTST
jgi:riboflavin biosynthesis pyrimidine reductase